MALISVGGYRLDLRTTDAGAPPAVVCVSSAGGAHESWAKLTPLIGDVAEAITYGRPGLAGSDPLPSERQVALGAGPPARELRALLSEAAVAPPYVLVGGSVGGYIIDRYAALWPDEVAGLVLIDPSPPYDFPDGAEFSKVIRDADEGWQISRAAVEAEMAAQAVENRAGRSVVVSGAVGYWQLLGPRPWQGTLTPTDIGAAWVEMQRWWADRLGAVQVTAPAAGHHVATDDPELVAAVVREVVTAARAGRRVNLLTALGAPSTEEGAGTAG